jgi:CPA1 family monovalent cation:H+ antiporter
VPNQTWLSVDNVWEFVDFLITSFSFVLIGNIIKLVDLFSVFGVVLTVFAIVLVSRFVIIFGMASLLNIAGNKIGSNWQWIVTWTGLRGVVSVMLASSLPSNASSLIEIVFGVVFVSLLVQGLSLEPFTRFFIKMSKD